MTFMFVVHTNQELGQCTEQVHAALDQIEEYFPHSSFLKSQRALLFYRSKDFEESNAIFTQLLLKDPYRLDTLDNYSNVLYVLNYRPQLAFLAHLAAQTDKFRPETCCIVGNYYSRNSEHEKAVMYFRRALTLDRCFTSAWTLMGHEYVEMKNTHAALESYRRAVDVNRKDYRAWYGLGLTYEMLEMHSYALFYHQRAAALRPFDAKTWQAVGACFVHVGKLQNAVRAYKRALVAGSYYEGGGGGAEGGGGGGAARQHHRGPADGAEGFAGLAGGILDPESLYQIALLYERMGDNGECAAYMELVLAQEVGAGGGAGGGGGGGAEGGDDLGGLVGDSQDSSALPGAGKGGSGGGAQGAGVGVTVTTSKARLWLARWLFYNGDFGRAGELAHELCQDGVEVEEAKALIRDIRSRADSQRIEGARGT
jgi:anaphase-promoting complex subunit 8